MTRDPNNRSWTHRRLGLGASKPSSAQLAHTDAMLSAVGARQAGTTSVANDPFASALLDFACDVDLVARVAELDTTPIPTELLRLPPATVKPRRFTWRVLVPAMGTAIAALVVGIAVLVGSGTRTIPSPAETATAESHQLLRHADALLGDASKASAADRERLVSQAEADLSHVSRLLPLTATSDRAAIRQQLQSLEERVRYVPAQPAPSGSGAGSSGSGRVGQPSTSGQGTSGQGGSSQSGTSGPGAETGTVVVPAGGVRRPSPPPSGTGTGGTNTTTNGASGTAPTTIGTSGTGTSGTLGGTPTSGSTTPPPPRPGGGPGPSDSYRPPPR